MPSVAGLTRSLTGLVRAVPVRSARKERPCRACQHQRARSRSGSTPTWTCTWPRWSTRPGGCWAPKGFPASTRGYVALVTWAERFGPVERIGIEGTGTYGAGLTRFVCAYGLEVVEVNRPDRSLRRRRGESDPIDAQAAARATPRPRSVRARSR
jgi:hypothetical protein